MSPARVAIVAVVVLATAATQAQARRIDPCPAGYSYAGVQSPTRAYGVSATLRYVARAVVAAGHVAAWVGVGGQGLGPGGSDDWLQAGLAQEAGGSQVVYYEYKRPGDDLATYVPLHPAQPGRKYSFVVYERAGRRDSWRVMVDGARVGSPVTLPGSHGAFLPIATAENWDGGVAGTCNEYAYDFSDLAVRSHYGGAWRPFGLTRVLDDPPYFMTLRSSGFLAATR